jgi:hypothetical protein
MLIAAGCTTPRNSSPGSAATVWTNALAIGGRNIGPVSCSFVLIGGSTDILSGSINLMNSANKEVMFTTRTSYAGHLEVLDRNGRDTHFSGSYDFLARSIRLNPGHGKREVFNIVLTNYYDITAAGEYTAYFSYDPRLMGMDLVPGGNLLKWSDDFRIKIDRKGRLKIARAVEN